MAQSEYSILPFGAAGVSGNGYPRWYLGTAAPASGTYNIGDVVWNIAPTAGGTLCWACTAAGSPGTWKACSIAS